MEKAKLFFGPAIIFEDALKGALFFGLDLISEPLFSSIMFSISLGQLINLRKKTRILIKKSSVLIGIPDFHGLLEENEIFL